MELNYREIRRDYVKLRLLLASLEIHDCETINVLAFINGIAHIILNDHH